MTTSGDSGTSGRVVRLFGADQASTRQARAVRVLVVDDQFVERKTLEAILRRLDRPAEVAVFKAPGPALEHAREKVPNLVITDYSTPGMDGAQFVRRFRVLPGCAEVPVLVVTVAEEPRVRYEALDAGANDFLIRPLDHREVLARCNDFLGLRFSKLCAKAARRPAVSSVTGERRFDPEAFPRQPARPAGASTSVQAILQGLSERVREAVSTCHGTVDLVLPRITQRPQPAGAALRWAFYHLAGDAVRFARGGHHRFQAAAQAGQNGKPEIQFSIEAYRAKDLGPCPSASAQLWRREDDRGPEVSAAEQLIGQVGASCTRTVGRDTQQIRVQVPAELPQPVLLLAGPDLEERVSEWFEDAGIPLDRVETPGQALARLVDGADQAIGYRCLLAEVDRLGPFQGPFPRLVHAERGLEQIPLMVIAEGQATKPPGAFVGYAAVHTGAVTAQTLARLCEAQDLEPAAERAACSVPAGKPVMLLSSDLARANDWREALWAEGHKTEVITEAEALLERISEDIRPPALIVADMQSTQQREELAWLAKALRFMFLSDPPSPSLVLVGEPPPDLPEDWPVAARLCEEVSGGDLADVVSRALAPGATR